VWLIFDPHGLSKNAAARSLPVSFMSTAMSLSLGAKYDMSFVIIVMFVMIWQHRLLAISKKMRTFAREKSVITTMTITIMKLQGPKKRFSDVQLLGIAGLWDLGRCEYVKLNC